MPELSTLRTEGTHAPMAPPFPQIFGQSCSISLQSQAPVSKEAAHDVEPPLLSIRHGLAHLSSSPSLSQLLRDLAHLPVQVPVLYIEVDVVTFYDFVVLILVQECT